MPFHVPEKVPWPALAELLNCKFQSSMNGNQGLTPDALNYLAQKLYGMYHQQGLMMIMMIMVIIRILKINYDDDNNNDNLYFTRVTQSNARLEFHCGPETRESGCRNLKLFNFGVSYFSRVASIYSDYNHKYHYASVKLEVFLLWLG